MSRMTLSGEETKRWLLRSRNNYWEVAYNRNSKFDERGTMIEMNG